MRHMSFMLTTQQISNETKTVTRRLGWWNLKPGDVLWAVEKGQGLKRGEKVRKLKQIRVVSVRSETLRRLGSIDYGISEVSKEGLSDRFPYIHSDQLPGIRFAYWFCDNNKGCTIDTPINRIEFEYVKEP